MRGVSSHREGWYSLHMQDDDTSANSQETVSFNDLVPPNIVEIPRSPEEISQNMAMDSISLGDFLSRPVNIASYSWLEASPIGTLASFDPWSLFFNNATVKYKLNNWAFIRCNLNVRFVYNASPFYYGSLMASYIPLPVFNQNHLVDDGNGNFLIPHSQTKGRSFIYPQCAEDVEMHLPFFHPNNFLKCQYKTDFDDMGKIYLNVVNQLSSANGVVGAGISVKVYAWATDVVLSGPSIGLAMQDEYEMDGPVSRPASAIANIASRLGELPYVGKFATATQFGAMAVARIAKLFGFTNVPVIADQHGFQPRPFPPIASADIGFPVEKLTLDPKNELTVDHSSVGLSMMDELPISYLVQKESYLTSFSWTTAQATDTLLFTSAVTPQLYAASADTDFQLYMSPMCWVSNMFNYWHGDVIFRFKVVCSKYHRGRLRFTFDPDGYAAENIVVDSSSSNVTMTEIIDISEKTDVEMRIPYQQYLAWCYLKSANLLTHTNERWGSAGFKHVRGETNGSITMRVQTVLTAPIDPSTIKIQVFVRGAENLEFGSPTSVGIERLQTLTLQDGDIEDTQPTCVSVGRPSRPVDHIYLTYMGERVASLRSLMRRYCKIFTYAPADSGNDMDLRVITLHRLPPPPGYLTSGALSTAKGIVAPAATFGFNWTLGNYLSYVVPAYVGNRGSINWTVNCDGSGPINQLTAVRDKAATVTASTTIPAPIGTASSNEKYWWTYTRTTGAGAILANTSTSSGLNFQVPFYSNRKFAPCDAKAQSDSTGRVDVANDAWTLEASLSNTVGRSTGENFRATFYAGMGTDFDLLYFLHVPTYVVMTSTPAAA